MRKSFFAVACLVLLPLAILARPKGVTAKGAELKLLADGFTFTEGPAVDVRGDVYFTDQPTDRILKWACGSKDGLTGELSVFLAGSGRANGLYFDRAGNLLSCSDMENELWSIAPDGSHTALVSGYEGRRLNGPNDLWVHPGGGVYFTDPLYVRKYWTRDPAMQQDGEHVYYLTPDRRRVIRVADGFVKPNGVVGTPDGRKLYVADIRAEKTYVYDIQPDGTLANRKLFAEKGSDGMTIDRQGNVYLTRKGVFVFDPAGEQIDHIPVDARSTANVCFGGRDRKTLFITATKGFYGIRMRTQGVK